MLVRHVIETGWPSGLELRRRVAAFARVDRAGGFKIGITDDPHRRAALYRHLEPEYGEMVVLYQTSSDDLVRTTERDLTQWFWHECDNMRLGGAGPHGTAPFYLYVVLR